MPLPAPVLHRRLELADEPATARVAQALADAFEPPAIVYLSGDLGTGKTTLVRALLRRLGFAGRVKSPSFTLVEPYNLSRFDLYHFDLYRFSSGDEWRAAGFDEYLRGDDVCVVEWAELGGDALPTPDLWLRLAFAPAAPGDEAVDAARVLEADAYTEAGRRWLISIAAAGSAPPSPGACSR